METSILPITTSSSTPSCLLTARNLLTFCSGYGDEAAAEIDDAVDHYFRECVAAGPEYCALVDKNQTAAQLHQEFDNFLTTLKNLGDGDATWYKFLNSFVGALKQPSSFAQLSNGTKLSYGQVPSKNAKRQTADFVPTSAAAAENAQGNVLFAITCAEYLGPRVATVDNFRIARDLYEKRSVYGGDGSLLSIFYACMGWETKAADEFTAPLTNVKTKNPVLFVNSLYDPVTPVVSARNASAGFVGSAVLVSDGAGVSIL